MTGDVDMLIAPPHSCGEIDSRQALLAICKCLKKQVRLTLIINLKERAACLGHLLKDCPGRMSVLRGRHSCSSAEVVSILKHFCLLHGQGLLLDDMASAAPASRGEGAATFMGVARHPMSPCARRVDIKFYPRRWGLATNARCTCASDLQDMPTLNLMFFVLCYPGGIVDYDL